MHFCSRTRGEDNAYVANTVRGQAEDHRRTSCSGSKGRIACMHSVTGP